MIDNKGNKTAVVIDLKKHKDLWEDFYDGMIARIRSDEPRESFEMVKKKLQLKGKLRG